MSLATEAAKSTSGFRVLVDVDSVDGTYSGRFSFNDFTPLGGSEPYDGRLSAAPSVSVERDSSYFGILVYGGSRIRLINADGSLDPLVASYNVIGATVRVWIGYDTIQLSSYSNIYTGYVDGLTVGDREMELSVSDLRKRLQSDNAVDIEFVDAVQGIENVLVGTYGITAGSSYFDVSAMTAAKALASDVYRLAPGNDTVEAAIGDCVKSTIGFFLVTGDGRYSYKMVDTSATSVATISRLDIIDRSGIEYGTQDIVASAAVKSVASYDYSVYATSPTIIGYGYCGCGLSDSILVIGPDRCVTATTTINVYRSTDAGVSWATAATVAAGTTVAAITKINDMGGGKAFFTIGSQHVNPPAGPGTVYRTLDYGSSWTSITTSLGVICDSVALESSAGSAIVVSRSGTSANVYKTSDYASSFSLTNTINTLYPYCISEMTSPGGTAHYLIITATPSDSGIVGISQYRDDMTATSFTMFTSINPVPGATCYPIAAGAGGSRLPNVAIVRASSSIGSVYTQANPKTTLLQLQSVECGNTTTKGPLFNLAFDSAGTFYTADIDGKLYRSYDIEEETGYYSGIENLDSHTKAYKLMFVNSYTDELFYCSDEDQLARLCFERWSTDSTHKASVVSAYNVDTLKEYDTILAYSADASTLASGLMDYYKDAHGTLSVTVGMAYHTVNVGDMVDVELYRNDTSILGTKKCEVMGKSYDLDNARVTLKLRTA